MKGLRNVYPPQLDRCDRSEIFTYFDRAWQLEDQLMGTVVGVDTFELNPDPLRNKLIFYLGHSAVFYINKLIQVNLLTQRLNPDDEILFEIGVDPEVPAELDAVVSDLQFPPVSAVWEYRRQAYAVISELINSTPINLPIHPQHPLWALMMGIEHQRIHIETSSMLIRQLPIEKVQRPDNWEYAPANIQMVANEMIPIAGGLVKLGKSMADRTYGWDIEYGHREIEVAPFFASKYLITNAEFLEFVQAGGYSDRRYWDEVSWEWKNEFNVQHPKFWLPNQGSYQYRAMFDEVDLPLDWPVEINYHEAIAYCRWRGDDIRLMTEAEWNLATYGDIDHDRRTGEDNVENYNLNLKFGSPTPVGLLATAKSHSGLYDLRGNVWEWLTDHLNPLIGYQPHPLYPDNSAPFFDPKHQMMLGGCWITNGTEALKYYRNWFRPHFYQHAGFRIAKS
jgi:5-histidylcysteine sulfoxide synthase